MSAKRKTSRRKFLTGKAAAEAVGERVRDAAEGAAGQGTRSDGGGGYLVEVVRRAMACRFCVFLNAGQYPQGTQAATAALELVGRLEGVMSVFRKRSQISRINRRAGDGAVEVEPGLFGLLCRAVELSRQTGGAFDITAGPLSEVWGFAKRRGTLPGKKELAEALADVGSRFVKLDEANGTIRFARPGVRLNLGGIGKGFALDRAAALLAEAGVGDFLFHGGNSSVLARGSRGDAAEAGGWSVGLVHPLRPKKRLAEIRLADRALATSGSGTQFFRHRGNRYGHVLDPRNGRPAEGVLSCTVLAPTAADADALSTALYVLGPEGAADFCGKHAEISAVVISPGDRIGGMEIRRFNLPEGDWRPVEPD